MGRATSSKKRAQRPTKRQLLITAEVVKWYLTLHYGTAGDPGMPAMFCDPQRVGAFAIDPEALRVGDSDALFRLLVTTTMFQRRQDWQILRVLQGISRGDAEEMTSARRLLALVDEGGCELMTSTATLREECDLAKDPETKLGRCGQNPSHDCHLKRHTVLLKRYGHFGKVPTSAALMTREVARGGGLAGLYHLVLNEERDPTARALRLQHEISRAWRVSEKISSMFLSAVTNPDLSDGLHPWREGVDWAQYVVIDSNVDLFLKAIRFKGPWTYAARREFIWALARKLDLQEWAPGAQSYNPRLVQQALYLFMSVSNRRALVGDCANRTPTSCQSCVETLSNVCPTRAPSQ